MLWQETRRCGPFGFFFLSTAYILKNFSELIMWNFEATVEGKNAFPGVKGDENCTAATFNIILKHDKYSISAFFLFIEGGKIVFLSDETFCASNSRTEQDRLKEPFIFWVPLSWMILLIMLDCAPHSKDRKGCHWEEDSNKMKTQTTFIYLIPAHYLAGITYLISVHCFMTLLFFSHLQVRRKNEKKSL